MASYVKSQLVKKLSMYFKDLTTETFNISLLKGEGTMHNLELKSEFIQESLNFPEWLVLHRATCDVVRVNLSYTKLKSQAVRLVINTGKYDILFCCAKINYHAFVCVCVCSASAPRS